MLFLSGGFISQDSLIPFRVLALEQSLKDKPLKAKSLEFPLSKGHMGCRGCKLDPESAVRNSGASDSLVYRSRPRMAFIRA